MDVDSHEAVLKGALEEHGEEDTEERRCKDTTLFAPLTGKDSDVAALKQTVLYMFS